MVNIGHIIIVEVQCITPTNAVVILRLRPAISTAMRFQPASVTWVGNSPFSPGVGRRPATFGYSFLDRKIMIMSQIPRKLATTYPVTPKRAVREIFWPPKKLTVNTNSF